MTATDFEQYCLFDAMMLPFAAGGLLLSLLQLPRLTDHLLAAAVGGAVFLVLAILSRGALGGGDALLFVTMVGIVLGGLAALLLMLLRLKKRKSAFAYGPYFALTTLALFLMRSV